MPPPFDPFRTNTGTINRGYQDPLAVPMQTGGTLGGHIPQSDFGSSALRGTVIPRHRPGRGGGSMGYNPHKPPNRLLHVDPGKNGSVVLDLDQLRPDAVLEAVQLGQDYTNGLLEQGVTVLDGEDLAKDGEIQRTSGWAAAAILVKQHAAAAQEQAALGGPAQRQPAGNGAAPPRVAPPSSYQLAAGGGTFQPAAPPPSPGPAPMRPTVTSPVSPASGPLARFQPAPLAQAAADPVAIERTAPRAVAAQGEATAPGYQVTFEFPTLGQHTVSYHYVARTEGGLVLGWDTRWPGQPYSPEHVDGKVEFAVRIEGSTKDYLAVSLGRALTHEHNGFIYFCLGVLQEADQ